MRAYYLFHPVCILTALALAAPVAWSQTASPELAAAVDAAWQRAPQARALEARRAEMQAGREAAQTWMAGSPEVGMSQRSDRWTEQNGMHETEISLSAPLWLPGQKTARQSLAQTGAEDLEAQISQARLSIAGEVRERLWAVAAARESLAEAQDHQHHLQEIAGDVMRRVKAGDLARSDGILARQEGLAAQASAALAQSRLNEAATRYLTLTGQAAVLSPMVEPIASGMQEPHPDIASARTALRRAQASLNVADAIRSDPPRVGILVRRERGNAAAEARNSVGVGIQIPIGTNARNRPLEAAARTRIATATAEVLQSESVLKAGIALARLQLTVSQQALETASARAELTREHTGLMEKAFRLGERGLAEVLRSRLLFHDAAVAERQQRVAMGLAHARLNQALGIVP